MSVAAELDRHLAGRSTFAHQSAIACLEQAKAAAGTVKRAWVIDMGAGITKIVARDQDDNVVCYAEVPRGDAIIILEAMGFDAGTDITDMISSFVRDGLGPAEALEAASLIHNPSQ